MTAPMDLREKVARIIDPSRWRVFDSYLADVKRKYADQHAAYDPEAFKDQASLAKADLILALPELAEVERLREALTAARPFLRMFALNQPSPSIDDLLEHIDAALALTEGRER